MQPPSVHFEDGIEEDVNTPPTRPRSQRVRMIVPEPSLLSSSPLPSEPPSEPHTQDAQDDESEDSLPLRKRHRRDMSEEALDRVFNGLNDILQRNERLKTQAKKKNIKNSISWNKSAAFYLPMPVFIRPIPSRSCPTSSRGWTTVRRKELWITSSLYRAGCLQTGRWFYRINHAMIPSGIHLQC